MRVLKINVSTLIASIVVTVLAACGGGGGSGVPSSYSLCGSVSGLGSATGLTLANGTETLPVAANATAFTFTTRLAQSANYNVTVASQPAGLTCSVNAGTGVIAAANVDAVVVACTTRLPPALALFAGNLGGLGDIDGMGPAARFQYPNGIATDSVGNIYVADTYNSTIRKINPDGVVSTLAGSAGVAGSADGTGAAARFSFPRDLATDSAGNVYVADGNGTIRKITPAGVVGTLAGAAGVSGSADGVGAAASFKVPNGLATDSAGNVYVADSGNNTIRKITPAGGVSTLAGTAGVSGSADGMGAAASFNSPEGLATDSAGNVYVADRGNHTIRKITPAGVVSTLAGTAGVSGSADGMGAVARFDGPAGLATDSAGNVYAADSGYSFHSNNTIRKITPAGVVSTMAGKSWVIGSADGFGAEPSFSGPQGLASDSVGNIYVADTYNHTIRKITPAGVVSTLAGTVGATGSADGMGAAARFSDPAGLATDSKGNVYVADSGNNTIRKITPAGVVSTLAGAAGVNGSADGMGAAASFRFPSALATDSAGNVYVADSGNNTIRKITPAGGVSTLAGTAGVNGSADGNGTAARFKEPYGIASDSAGNVYVADTHNSTIRKITPVGVVSTLAGSAGVAGSADGIGAAARFNAPIGIATDSAGNFYVAEFGNHTIRKITPDGLVSTLAGTAGVTGSADGIGAAASFGYLLGLAVDSAGNVYVADSGHNTIRKITPAGVVSTLAGMQGRVGFAAGALPGNLSGPNGLAIAGTTLYITMPNGVAVVTNLP